MWPRVVSAAVVLVGIGSSCGACSIPVFRYALERWQPDLYEVLVFHRGPLSADAGQVAESRG